jgi:hypothetical protein
MQHAERRGQEEEKKKSSEKKKYKRGGIEAKINPIISTE